MSENTKSSDIKIQELERRIQELEARITQLERKNMVIGPYITNTTTDASTTSFVVRYPWTTT